jgi:DMSO/TMAO reductase YedYZ molybdopterin-dependent catalytic subunit
LKNKILITAIVVLIIAAGVLGFLNREQLAGRQALVDDPGVAIKIRGEEISTIYLDEIRSSGEEEFPVTLRSSGKPPRDLILTGVPLKAILHKLDPQLLDNSVQVVARAIDGYTVAYTMDEVLLDNHIFLVYLEDGESLGSKAEGGSGPLMIVPRQDEFGQRWCKFVVEVDVD